ncbi:MAG: glutamate synthase [Candidatus Eisenbacteria bacterium]|uniref:Glutamate synthase n=1 Tax=Eiseniibacteriota bacterium TaxID=2212470 RepID=A0A538U4D6_UNCEI|nr:MAG: glutamate synthase [Candidatus Eisenbacteria bacterium]
MNEPNAAAGAIAPDRLEGRIADAKPTYGDGEAAGEANRCLYCHDAPCVTACPTGIDIPGFIRKIATGNVRGSARTILSANLLGYSCARVCPVEVLCVGACVYNDWHRYPPIAIGRLQRYAVETTLNTGRAATLFTKAPATGKRVACVGAGPASLALAGYLSLEGVAVTVLEKRALAGGLNTTGVAPYKMHVEGALAEVEFIRSLGVTIRTGVEVGRDVQAADLLRDHDAVFIGVGLGADGTLGIPGESGAGVMGATAWIERLKLEPGYALTGVQRALVVGGGNTAIDAARELARLGIADVAMVYRRTAAEMPGYAHEMDLARREGVRLVERAVPKEFARDAGGRLTALRLADGRELPADLVIVGIGQTKLRELATQFLGVALDAKGFIVVEPATGRTGNPKVFAGGDALGGELVVTAVQEAKRAARGICAALGVRVRPDAAMMAGHA